jgi:hypothetical protein
MYEPKFHPPIPRELFIKRFMLHLAAALALLLFSIGGGIAGYEHFEHLPWRDAFLNASMLLGGMGPVDAPHSNGGKVFAALFALYAGLVFLVAASLVIAPVVHRAMHKFHWEKDR